MAQIKVLIAYPLDMDGSAYHRLHVPALALATAGMQVTRVDDIMHIPEAELAAHDVLIVNRQITNLAIDPKKSNDPLLLVREAMARIERSGIRVVLDMDDTWRLPANHALYRWAKVTAQKEAILWSMAVAHVVWCSTEPLLRDVTSLGHKPHLVPNGISKWDAQWEKLDKVPSPELRLGVVCNQTHLRDIKRLKPALRRMKRQPGWHVVALGVPDEQHRAVIDALGTDRVHFRPWLPAMNYAEHYRHMDVLLCPLDRDKFNAYRSDIKLAECAFSRTAVVCEMHGPYRGTRFCVNHWETDLPLLVRDRAELMRKHLPNPVRFGTDESDKVRIRTIETLMQH